jgi:XTP/dITP diphosphohydrolase
MTKTIIIATHNANKAAEIQEILGDKFRYFSLREMSGAPQVIEDGNSFAANAIKKAVQIGEWVCASNFLAEGEAACVLADDSGLEVDALKGAPGVLSARFASDDLGISGNSPDAENNRKLLRLMAHVPESARTARFHCVIALTPLIDEEHGAASVCDANQLEMATELFEGKCEGQILKQERGFNGFGYDPLFLPHGYGQSFAQMGDAIKNKLSHRSQALVKVRARLFT